MEIYLPVSFYLRLNGSQVTRTSSNQNNVHFFFSFFRLVCLLSEAILCGRMYCRSLPFACEFGRELQDRALLTCQGLINNLSDCLGTRTVYSDKVVSCSRSLGTKVLMIPMNKRQITDARPPLVSYHCSVGNFLETPVVYHPKTNAQSGIVARWLIYSTYLLYNKKSSHTPQPLHKGQEGRASPTSLNLQTVSNDEV